MSRGSEAEAPTTGSSGVDRVVSECRWRLAERGELVVCTGCFRAGPLAGSIHCDFGPLTQDKNANQDYALAWCPAESGEDRQPRLVLALADGLTNSYRSEWAAMMACWVAVRAVVEAAGKMQPVEVARFAFNEAGEAIARRAEEFTRDQEASCPEGQFLSTWKYILKKGGLLQTTLSLAWIDRDQFNLAMIGDGGALWRGYDGSRWTGRTRDRVLAACNLESQQVHALGPAEPYVQEFDCWRQKKIDGPFLCAMMTDGVGRGIGMRPIALLEELDAYDAITPANVAQDIIARAIRERAKDFDDNLTLAIIRGRDIHAEGV
jgi:serine/threonine protein phosphatase PrpC